MTPKPITCNSLYYGDNLQILREYIPDESVDLVYLDPPFKSIGTSKQAQKEKKQEGKQGELGILASNVNKH